jgi:sugar phosphate isomerase/epimerase
MRALAEMGYQGWEPGLATAARVAPLAARIRAAGLAMPSAFVAGQLAGGQAERATGRITRILQALGESGCRMVAVYPRPLPGGKSADALARQADRLNHLGQAANRLGLRLLYHPEEHDFASPAAEAQAMLAATDPTLVGLCLDPDTTWRGLGMSGAALTGFAAQHAARIGAVHLRQSRHGLWALDLAAGDIDLAGLAQTLADAGVRPLPVVELAWMGEAPGQTALLKAHAAALVAARKLFPGADP